MEIDGKGLANELLLDIKRVVQTLKHNGIIPTLAVIQVGDDEGSTAYIRQKERKANDAGITLIKYNFPSHISLLTLISQIENLNADPAIHGIIVQRPLPSHIDPKKINEAVAPEKDVDSFHPDSKFDAPVALAVLHVLSFIFHIPLNTKYQILYTKKIVILGRGQTAGAPIAHTFDKYHIPYQGIHRTTHNLPAGRQDPQRTTHNADVIISCVGKGRVVTKDMIKKGVILIGVGISRDNGTLIGDYNEDEIKDIASYYTPTPGGIGPLTVAFLLRNLVEASRN